MASKLERLKCQYDILINVEENLVPYPTKAWKTDVRVQYPATSFICTSIDIETKKLIEGESGHWAKVLQTEATVLKAWVMDMLKGNNTYDDFVRKELGQAYIAELVLGDCDAYRNLLFQGRLDWLNWMIDYVSEEISKTT